MIDEDLTATRIGRRARELRATAGWSMQELAHRIGVAEHVVASIEHGLRLPNIELLYRVAAGLQVAPGELLPSADELPRSDVHLPVTDEPDAPTAQVIGGGPGHPTQTYLFELEAGQSDGGFGTHQGDELVVVMSGEVVCSALGEDDVVVRAGRSHVVETGVPHGLRAGDEGPARFLLVCTDASED